MSDSDRNCDKCVYSSIKGSYLVCDLTDDQVEVNYECEHWKKRVVPDKSGSE